jgi:hydroxymethylpyrimidine pyrophosphatase-like HAD family hydrolase
MSFTRRPLALATDFDETIALDGVVDAAVLAALHGLGRRGCRLILVTGRGLPDLCATFPGFAVFDRIVAENGAVLFEPAARRERLLGPPPPAVLIAALEARRVTPLHVGRVVVATHEPHEHAVLDAIHACGLELQIIFNKGSVMVLPSGINKASGLAAATDELGIPLSAVVGVGDAENDNALLGACGISAAVANALPALKEEADIVLDSPAGAGVIELIGRLWGTAEGGVAAVRAEA